MGYSPQGRKELDTTEWLSIAQHTHSTSFPGGSVVKNPPAYRETQVRSLDQEDPPVEGMAIHSSILAWEIPWIEEPGGLQSMGWWRAGHDLSIKPPSPLILKNHVLSPLFSLFENFVLCWSSVFVIFLNIINIMSYYLWLIIQFFIPCVFYKIICFLIGVSVLYCLALSFCYYGHILPCLCDIGPHPVLDT